MSITTSLTYGYITGRFAQFVGDSSDLDSNPDVIPIPGLNITFIPSSTSALDMTDNLVFLNNAVITCTTDGDGYLVDGQNNQGVYLVATDIDSSILNPSGLTYKVLIRQGSVVYSQFSITVPSGSTQDLSTLSPVPSSTETPIVRGPRGLTGPTGPQGPMGEVSTSQMNTAIETALSGFVTDNHDGTLTIGG